MTFNTIYKLKASLLTENIPIHVTNDIELANLPQNFMYCKESFLGPGAKEEDLEYTFSACDCQGTCLSKECPCTFGNIPYSSQGTISESVLNPHSPPVFECGPVCTCQPDSCCNDVVQQGIRHQLCIYKTQLKGLGVKTEVPIARGNFVCEYAGEVIGKGEASRRISTLKPQDSNYIIVVKEHFANKKCWETIIDPTFFGNVGRFLNHSCDPNLVLVPIRAGSMIPRLAFFASKDIEAGDELTYDYSGISFSMAPSPSIINANSKACHCEAPNCKLYLPSDPFLL